MALISAAIGAAVAIGGWLGSTALGTIALNMAVGVGLSLVQQALFAPDSAQQRPPAGITGTMGRGGTEPRAFMVGRFATPGTLLYAGTFGAVTPNAHLCQAICLSDLPVNALSGIYVDGERCTIDWENPFADRGYPVVEYRKDGKDNLWVKFYDGTQTAADPQMVSQFGGDPDYPWDETAIVTGCAYAVMTARLERSLFSGFPEYVFEIEGARWYDIRKDSTAGGAGTHRWNDFATWEYSENDAVISYNILRGVSYQGQWLYGLQTTGAAQFPYASWAAAMDVCDVQVAKLEGTGTEAQYRVGGEIRVGDEIIDPLKKLMTACEGRIAEVGGVYKIHIGVPDAPVLAFTDQDIVSTQGQDFDPFRGLADQLNGIAPRYPNPVEAYQEHAGPTRWNDARIAAVGGRQLPTEVAYDFVPFKGQVQRLTAQQLAEYSRQRRHTLVLGPSAQILEPTDCISWTSARNGYVDKLFRVEGVEDLPRGDVRVQVVEVDPADYDFDPATQYQDDPDGPIIIQRPPAQPIAGWQAGPATIRDAANNARRPSIAISFEGDAADVKEVRVQVRLAATGAIVFDGLIPYGEVGPDNSVKSHTLNGTFLPATLYEVRGIFVPYSGRDTEWSGWLPVTTPNALFGTQDVLDNAIIASKIADAAITADKLMNQAVTSLKLADEAVTETKLAVAAVSERVIASGAVVAGKLADLAVTQAKVAAGAIITSKLANGGVDGTKLADSAVIASKLANGAVTEIKLAADAVSEAKLATGAVSQRVIAIGAVVSDKLADLAVTQQKVAAGAILTSKLADGAITETKISDDSISAPKIKAGAITAGKISAGAVTATEIAAGAVNTSELAAGAVVAGSIATDAVTAVKIAAGAVTTEKLQAGSVVAEKIAGGTITGDKVAANTLTGEKIIAGAITARELVLSDFDNLVPNGDWVTADAASFYDYNGASIVVGFSTNQSHTQTGERSLVLQKSDLNSAVNIVLKPAFYINVTGGLTYYCEVAVASNIGSTPAGFYYRVHWMDADNIDVGYEDVIADGAVGAFAVYSKQIIAPAGARLARIQLINHSSNTTAPNFLIDRVVMRLAKGAQLIVDGGITAVKIAASAVTAGKVAANAITASEISAGAVAASELAANAVIADKIAANAVTAAKVAANAVAAATIQSGAVTADKIAASAITADKVAAASITGAKLVAGSITARELILTHYDNLVPNGGWELADWSTFYSPSGASINPAFLTAPQFVQTGGQSFILQKQTLTESVNVTMRNEYAIPIAEGETYYFETEIFSNVGAAPAGFYYRLIWLDVAKAVISSTDLVQNAPIPASWTVYKGQVTPPSGARFALVRIYNHSTNTVTGNLIIDRVVLRLAKAAELIVDGSITADKLAVTSLSAITGNVGELTAGVLKSSDGLYVLDLNTGVETWDDGT